MRNQQQRHEDHAPRGEGRNDRGGRQARGSLVSTIILRHAAARPRRKLPAYATIAPPGQEVKLQLVGEPDAVHKQMHRTHSGLAAGMSVRIRRWSIGLIVEGYCHSGTHFGKAFLLKDWIGGPRTRTLMEQQEGAHFAYLVALTRRRRR